MPVEYIYQTSIHPEPLPYPVITISLSDLRSRSGTDDELFEDALRKLDPMIGEGYILVVLAAISSSLGQGTAAATGSQNEQEDHRSKRREPGLGWWLSKWRSLPTKYRKNLKRMYLVHPSPYMRTITSLILPFLSPKAYAKIHLTTSIFDLYSTYGIPLTNLRLPLAVLEQESRLRMPIQSTWTSSFTSAVGTVMSYIPFSSLISRAPYHVLSSSSSNSGSGEGYWDRTLDELVETFGGVPPLFEELRTVILEECVITEGIFRRTPGPNLRPVIVDLLDLPIEVQPIMPWKAIASSDPLLPPKILSRLLAKTSVPVIRSDQYHLVRRCTTLNDMKTIFFPELSSSTRLILSHVIFTLHEVSKHASETRMTPLNLAICLAPDLTRGADIMEDASLCLPPGKKMPQMGFKQQEQQGQGTLVGILEILIRDPQ